MLYNKHMYSVCRSNTKCKYRKRRANSTVEVNVGDNIISQVTRLRYIGSIIQDNEKINGDVNNKIQAGWIDKVLWVSFMIKKNTKT
ncbi:hypothetical protein Lal_00042930 [Lupinus albus]|nr:hypothetical protein Lal_00042930 [Lupinus albus]